MIYYKDSTTDSLTLQRLALHVALVQKSHHDDFQLPHDQIETSLNGPLRLFFFNHASNLVTKLEFSVLKTVFLITEVSPWYAEVICRHFFQIGHNESRDIEDDLLVPVRWSGQHLSWLLSCFLAEDIQKFQLVTQGNTLGGSWLCLFSSPHIHSEK